MTVLGLVRDAAEIGSDTVTCSHVLSSPEEFRKVFLEQVKKMKESFFFKDEQIMDGFWNEMVLII